MLGVRRASLVRQMAFRQDSNESELSVRHGHLAAIPSIPDSPRPQKDDSAETASLPVVMSVPPTNPPTVVQTPPTPVSNSSQK